MLFQRTAPACAVEIVAAYEDGRPWRTNEELVRFNAGLSWRTVRLGLAEVLAANQNEKLPAEERYPLVKGVRDPDRWLKTVARVGLNATDVARVAAATSLPPMGRTAARWTTATRTKERACTFCDLFLPGGSFTP